MQPAVRIALLSALALTALLPLARQASAGSGLYAELIATHAAANGIPVELATAVVIHESNFNPGVTGLAGEIGLMQIKLSTARGIGYRGTREALYDPATNIAWGMKYLGEARRLAGGSECGTLSRYNGGLATSGMIRSYCRGVAAKAAAAGRPLPNVQIATAAAPAPIVKAPGPIQQAPETVASIQAPTAQPSAAATVTKVRKPKQAAAIVVASADIAPGPGWLMRYLKASFE